MLFSRIIERLAGFQQLLPVMWLLDTRRREHVFVIPDARKPGAYRHTCPRCAVFSAYDTQNTVVEGIFTHGFNGFADGIAIQKLLFIHHFGVVMADFDDFRQCASAGQSNDFRVVSILFHRNLFHRDGRILFLKFFNEFCNNGLTLLLHRRMHKFNGD